MALNRDDILKCNKRRRKAFRGSDKKKKTFLLQGDILDKYMDTCMSRGLITTQVLELAMLEVVRLLEEE